MYCVRGELKQRGRRDKAHTYGHKSPPVVVVVLVIVQDRKLEDEAEVARIRSIYASLRRRLKVNFSFFFFLKKGKAEGGGKESKLN